MPSQTPTLMLIDGHSLAFRSYYAFARSREGGLRTSTGIPTSVCYGFLKSLLDMIEVEKPNYAAVAFDLGQPTFRHEADATYKEGRPEVPEDFLEDVKNLQALLAGFGLQIVTAPRYEADDVIGALACKAKDKGYRVKILSGDQDLFQLIDPNEQITVLHLGNTFTRGSSQSTVKEFGVEQVREKLGILPSQVVDYKALCGDSSDNIPGVKGIGKKTAVQLLTTYGSLEKIYASLGEMKGAVKKKLEVGQADADHSQYLAKIVVDVPLEVELADFKLAGFDPEVVAPALKKLEFQYFLNRLNTLQIAFGGDAPAPVAKADISQANSPEADDDIAFFTAEETDLAQQQAPAAVKIHPQIITTLDQLTTLVERLKTFQDPQTLVAWDTETTALEPRDAELVGIGCGWGTGLSDMAYIPMGHTTGENLDTQTVLETLRPVLENAAYPKALQNAKFDRLVLRCQGVNLTGVVFDTMLASYVLNPEARHNLTDLSLRYLGITAKSYSDLVPKGKTIADVDIPAVAEYCGMDVFTTFQLVSKLQPQLADLPELLALFTDTELPLEPVLAEMEYQGVRIDQDYLQNFSKTLETDLAAIEQTAYKLAEEEFNLGSPKQLGDLLAKKLGETFTKKSRKTKSGQYSTDASTLEKLEGEPIVDAVLEYRTLAKLKSTYVDALPLLIRPDTKRVHTDFNQAITATGRLSSSAPNLQNIPIRTAFSRQIRAAFIPETNWYLVSADYSQIELRILAHLSEEPVLIEAYQNNQDVHALTARLLLEKEDITPEERRLGKVINFGVIYGMGAARFAREVGVNRTDAKTFIDRFNERYSRVFDYLQQMQKDAIAHGYVQTIKGRRRYFNFTSNSLRRLKAQNPDEIILDKLRPGGYDAGLLRAAANAPIQGSSADIIKIAMIRLHKILKDYQARLLLQVHDELVFEIPPEEWEDLEPKIRSTMESAVELKVPLVVEAHAAQNWMAAK